MSVITRNNIRGQLALIWQALECYREDCIPEGQDESYDTEWSELCDSMHWITEDLESFHQTQLAELPDND